MSRMLHVAVIATMAALGTSAVALAQTSRAEQVDIGFAFMAGRTMLPAGQYWISFDEADPAMLLFQSHDHRVRTWVDTTMVTERRSRPNPGLAELVFDRYGDQYFLREAWIDGEAQQTQPTFLRARAERQAAAEHQAAVRQRVVTKHRG